jgi:hypothetical protein
MNIAGSIPAPAIMGSTMDNIFCTFSSSKAQARSSNRSVYAVRLRRTHGDVVNDGRNRDCGKTRCWARMPHRRFLDGNG